MSSFTSLSLVVVVLATFNPTLAADNKIVRVSKINDNELIDITIAIALVGYIRRHIVHDMVSF